MQLRVRMNLHRVAPGFPKDVKQEERAELVDDFAATAAVVVATVDVEDILHGGG